MVFSGDGISEVGWGQMTNGQHCIAGDAHTKRPAVKSLSRFERHARKRSADATASRIKLERPNNGYLCYTFHSPIERGGPLAAHLAASHLHLCQNHQGTPGRWLAASCPALRALIAAAKDHWTMAWPFAGHFPVTPLAPRSGVRSSLLRLILSPKPSP